MRSTLMAPRRLQDPIEGDPDRLEGPAVFARILGHGDTTTISHWVAGDAPPGFPAPEAWKKLPTRDRPLWRVRTMREFAQHAPVHRAGGGSSGGRRRSPHPHAGDPRLGLARALLRQRPDSPDADLVRALQSEHGGRRSTWHAILKAARDYPGT